VLDPVSSVVFVAADADGDLEIQLGVAAVLMARYRHGPVPVDDVIQIAA
jgi:hypothetical protein